MKKLILFLAVLLMFPWDGSARGAAKQDVNRVQLGTASVVLEIDGMPAQKLDSLLDVMEVLGETTSVYAKSDEEILVPLTRNGRRFEGEFPMECREEIGGIIINCNGTFLFGMHVQLTQSRPIKLKLYLTEDLNFVNLISDNPDDISYWELLDIGRTVRDGISIFPLVPDDKALYESWENVRAYELDSVWPALLREAMNGKGISEKELPWVVNNLKWRFAAEGILPYVKGAAIFAGVKVDEPPMEAYSYLDSIDYSPNVFLKKTMYYNQRALLEYLLHYPCGGFEAIGETPVDEWQERLSQRLAPAMKERPKLLLDLLAGMSYISQIERHEPLTERQKENIDRGFTDDIGRIVLARNEKLVASLGEHTALQDLSERVFRLKEFIDSAYAGRPVVVDLWNTWCGPCLMAMGQTEGMKQEFADTDLVFLYVSDTTSPLEEWKRRAVEIGGEQVRVNDGASRDLLEANSLTGFPSYLFFDRDHRLVHAQTSFPGQARYRALLEQIARP